MTLPLLDHPASLPRLRALLALSALEAIGDGADQTPRWSAGELRSFDVKEVVAFTRRYQPGSGSSVAFTYSRGERIALR